MPRKKIDVQVTNTLDEIAIPKGSLASYELFRRVDYHDSISIVVPLAPGRVGEWVMSREDAVSLGIIPNDLEKPNKPPHKPEKDENPKEPQEEEDLPDNLASGFA